MRKVERKGISFFLKLLIFINMSAYPFLIYSQDVFDRSKIKTKKFPLPKGAIYMDLKYSLPTEEMIGQDIYIKKGACLSTDLDSNIYVVDSSQGVIFKFNQKGEFLKKIGSKGKGPGDLLEPQYLKVDNNGNLIIYEEGNMRYQILDSEGAYINSFTCLCTLLKWLQYVVYRCMEDYPKTIMEFEKQFNFESWGKLFFRLVQQAVAIDSVPGKYFVS